MKTERIAILASVVFMIAVWLVLTAFLALALTGRLLTQSTAGHTLLGLVALVWLLIPIQVVMYYRKHRA